MGSKIRQYFIIGVLIITLILLVLGLIFTGKNQWIMEKFAQRKQKLKDLTQSSNEQIKDIEKQEQQAIDNLEELKKKEHEILSKPVATVNTDMNSEQILDTLNTIQKG